MDHMEQYFEIQYYKEMFGFYAIIACIIILAICGIVYVFAEVLNKIQTKRNEKYRKSHHIKWDEDDD